MKSNEILQTAKDCNKCLPPVTNSTCKNKVWSHFGAKESHFIHILGIFSENYRDSLAPLKKLWKTCQNTRFIPPLSII